MTNKGNKKTDVRDHKMSMPVSNGSIEQGDLCAVIVGDVICRFETISPEDGLNLRVLSDNSLVQKAPALIRIVTAAEKITYGESAILVEAQATYDAASTALTVAGGEPCPEEP